MYVQAAASFSRRAAQGIPNSRQREEGSVGPRDDDSGHDGGGGTFHSGGGRRDDGGGSGSGEWQHSLRILHQPDYGNICYSHFKRLLLNFYNLKSGVSIIGAVHMMEACNFLSNKNQNIFKRKFVFDVCISE